MRALHESEVSRGLRCAVEDPLTRGASRKVSGITRDGRSSLFDDSGSKSTYIQSLNLI